MGYQANGAKMNDNRIMSQATATAGPRLGSPALERCVEEEILEWYRMSPRDRWTESLLLWDTFILLGGQLDPEPDSQSPFYDEQSRRRSTTDGRSSVRAVRRSRV